MFVWSASSYVAQCPRMTVCQQDANLQEGTARANKQRNREGAKRKYFYWGKSKRFPRNFLHLVRDRNIFLARYRLTVR